MTKILVLLAILASFVSASYAELGTPMCSGIEAWPSVLVVDDFPKIEIYGEDGRQIASRAPAGMETPVVMRVPPQLAVHSIHNVDTTRFHAVRIEYKRACPAK